VPVSTTRLSPYIGAGAALAGIFAAGVGSSEGVEAYLLFVGSVVLVIGVAYWLPWILILAATLLLGIGASFAHATITGESVFYTRNWVQLPGLLCLAAAIFFLKRKVRDLVQENAVLTRLARSAVDIDGETGAFREELLRPALEAEVARARRFGRELALMLVSVSEMRQRFDYRDGDRWVEGFRASAAILLRTRNLVDRTYRYGDDGFALVLPETDRRGVEGLVRRLTREAKRARPPEGSSGGPLPLHYGATFFPSCATTLDNLLTRASVAVTLAEKSPTRLRIDSADAPDLPPPETMRRHSATPVRQKDKRAEEEAGLRLAPALKTVPAVSHPTKESSLELGAPSRAAEGSSVTPSGKASWTLLHPEGALHEVLTDLLKDLSEIHGVIGALRAVGPEPAERAHLNAREAVR
jgi:GGDEF domain-containing protein